MFSRACYALSDRRRVGATPSLREWVSREVLVRNPAARAVCFILFVALAASFAGCGEAGSQPHGQMPPPEVNVVTIEARSLPVVYEYTGRTAGYREVEVRARVTGILLKRHYEEGAPVKRGQPPDRPGAVRSGAREGRGRSRHCRGARGAGEPGSGAATAGGRAQGSEPQGVRRRPGRPSA